MIPYKRIIVFLTLLTFTLVCCKNSAPATKSAAPSLVPDGNDLAIARNHWPGTTLDNLSDGYKIYSDKCVDCHDAKLPQDFSIDEWNTIMPKMGRKAHLDSLQYKSVYHYILARRESILSAKR